MCFAGNLVSSSSITIVILTKQTSYVIHILFRELYGIFVTYFCSHSGCFVIGNGRDIKLRGYVSKMGKVTLANCNKLENCHLFTGIDYNNQSNEKPSAPDTTENPNGGGCSLIAISVYLAALLLMLNIDL